MIKDIIHHTKKIYMMVILTIIVLAIISVSSFFIWQHFYPVTTHGAWSYKVVYDAITKPGALLLDKQGNLIVAQALDDGKGFLLNISPDGKRTILVKNLYEPDGLSAFKESFVYSQEDGRHPVIWYVNGELKPLFTGTNIQGLTLEGDYLYAIEDRKHKGRLFKYHLLTGDITILRENLNQSETLAICPDGSKFYNNKIEGQIRQLVEDGSDPVLLKGLNQPTFLKCTTQGLWITEDATHQARLLLYTPAGELITILSSLRAPQYLLQIGENQFLLSEQGRNRILRVYKN